MTAIRTSIYIGVVASLLFNGACLALEDGATEAVAVMPGDEATEAVKTSTEPVHAGSTIIDTSQGTNGQDIASDCGCGSTSRHNIASSHSSHKESTESEVAENKASVADTVEVAEEIDMKTSSEKYSAKANINKDKALPRTNQMVYIQVCHLNITKQK